MTGTVSLLLKCVSRSQNSSEIEFSQEVFCGQYTGTRMWYFDRYYDSVKEYKFIRLEYKNPCAIFNYCKTIFDFFKATLMA